MELASRIPAMAFVKVFPGLESLETIVSASNLYLQSTSDTQHIQQPIHWRIWQDRISNCIVPSFLGCLVLTNSVDLQFVVYWWWLAVAVLPMTERLSACGFGAGSGAGGAALWLPVAAVIYRSEHCDAYARTDSIPSYRIELLIRISIKKYFI